MSTFTTTVAVDATTPVVTAVAETGSSPYKTGDTFGLDVTFSGAVTVVTTGGVPYIPVTFRSQTPASGTETIGSVTRNVPYVSGTGTTDLVFNYAVVANDYAEAGEVIVGNAIVLNGGTISGILDLTPAAFDPSAYTVNHRPVITSVTGIDSTEDFQTGDVISLSVTFDGSVVVEGAPSIKVLVGSQYRYLAYASGSGSSTLVFSYTVTKQDFCKLNDFVVNSFIQLQAGDAIEDSHENDAILDFTPVVTKYVQVNPVAAINAYALSVSEVTPGAYVTTGHLDVTVTFSEAITVTGSPEIALPIDSGTVQLVYNSGTGTSALVFRHTVGSGDRSENGGATLATSINLNSGTLTGADLNPISLSLPPFSLAVTSTINYQPKILSVALAGGGGTDTKQFLHTDTLALTVTFDQNVTVAVSSPTIPVVIGANTRTATYASGSGTPALVFNYSMQSTDYAAAGGLTVTSPVLLTGGSTINGAGSNPALLTFTASFPSATATPVIAAPTVTGITNGHAYLTGDTISVTATFPHPVHIVGTPRIACVLDSGTVYLNYASGDGSAAIVFSHVVAGGENAQSGISLTSPIALNGGHIYDNNGQSVAVASSTFSITTTTVKVNYADVVSSVAGITNGHTYHTATNDPVSLTLTYEHAVDVTGTPEISIAITTSGPLLLGYASGSGTAAIVFSVATASPEACSAAGFVVSGTILPNGGTIVDHVSGAPAKLTFTPPTTDTVTITT